ncbi:uncharacterized protein LOC127860261 [Dreissena polymorpha]|uniref:Uncharacterized protein n=1 Tax=Dreissena polymorpha TaxID=45954 RepID=A0A9D3YMC4_DREPO|nr:uncharacterized protein LOC127860261 [Dreissena polymorpha]KAH3701439.1 hypothetical protein DPMN_076427 [Dreissena polymorpha]
MHFTYPEIFGECLLLILAFRLNLYALAQSTTCGTVNGTSEANRLLVRFAPSDYFKNNFLDFRWVFGRNVISQLNLTYKYNIDGYNLTITNLSSNDSGDYYVDCWKSGNTYESTHWVFNYDYYIKAFETSTSKTTSLSTLSKPPQETQANATTIFPTWLDTKPTTFSSTTIILTKEHDLVQASSHNDTQPLSQSTIIIVCVCWFFVALIAAGTVVVIRVKGKPSKPSRPKSTIIPQEGTSNDGRPAASMYDEISSPTTKKSGRKSVRFMRRSKRRLPEVPMCAYPPSENPYADIPVDEPAIEKTVDSNKPELQYADLDLVTTSKDDNGARTKTMCNAVEENTVKCQYATIDFETKAFVAPVRKAPSSWYKRKNKNRNDT